MPTTKTLKTKRAKGGKGKKDRKLEAKSGKESDVDTARANAALWELRLKVTNQDLADYKEASHNLARANEELTGQLRRMEADCDDMNCHWERQVEAKELKLTELEEHLKRNQAQAVEEKNKMSMELNTVQDEVKRMKQKEAQLQQEIIYIRECMDIAEKNHEENLILMENKFHKEKECVARETMERYNLQEVLLKQDHREAIEELEGLLNATIKQRDHLNEALENTLGEAQDLKKLTQSLVEENIVLDQRKEMLELNLKKSTTDNMHKKEKLSELMAKIASMEQALELKSRQLKELEEKEQKANAAILANHAELNKLQKILTMQEKELQNMKLLATTIVNKRKEMEKFFYEALDQVKQEVANSRFRYKKEAKKEYFLRFRDATAGRMKFPPICSFNDNPKSTNSIHTHMDAAAKWSHHKGDEVQISDLTWEQKEQVLRFLFAKMNGQTERSLCPHLTPRAASKRQEDASDADVAGRDPGGMCKDATCNSS